MKKTRSRKSRDTVPLTSSSAHILVQAKRQSSIKSLMFEGGVFGRKSAKTEHKREGPLTVVYLLSMYEIRFSSALTKLYLPQVNLLYF